MVISVVNLTKLIGLNLFSLMAFKWTSSIAEYWLNNLTETKVLETKKLLSCNRFCKDLTNIKGYNSPDVIVVIIGLVVLQRVFLSAFSVWSCFTLVRVSVNLVSSFDVFSSWSATSASLRRQASCSFAVTRQATQVLLTSGCWAARLRGWPLYLYALLKAVAVVAAVLAAAKFYCMVTAIVMQMTWRGLG